MTRPPFQFGLGSLFVLMAAVAVVAAFPSMLLALIAGYVLAGLVAAAVIAVVFLIDHALTRFGDKP